MPTPRHVYINTCIAELDVCAVVLANGLRMLTARRRFLRQRDAARTIQVYTVVSHPVLRCVSQILAGLAYVIGKAFEDTFAHA